MGASAGVQAHAPARVGVLPGGRRARKGELRWYLVQAPDGREQALCDAVRKLVPDDVLEDAFVMRKERWMHRRGEWFLDAVPMYRGYFFVATRDVAALDKALARLSVPVRIARTDGRVYVPLSADAQQWFQQSLDESHTLRSSTAVIVDGQLHVQAGPLVGQERRVSGIDRHRRSCRVTVCEGDRSFSEVLPLDVPFKS